MNSSASSFPSRKKQRNMSKVLYVLIVACFASVHGQEITDKICVENNYDRSACAQISRSNEFACLEDVVSKIDCFLNIDRGEPQFSVVTAEEAFLAAPLVSENVVIIGEIISEHLPYKTAVLVRKPYEGTFEGLRNKRFCHPGFEHEETLTKFVLNEFESKILNTTNYCETTDNATVIEKKLRALSTFFGSSCRPGNWTESEELDAELKTKYPSLCDLCGVERCGISYKEPFSDVFTCLTQKGGDIAITTLTNAVAFFNSTDNVNNFQYLCHNGQVSDGTPCTWTQQMYKVIITNKNAAEKVTKFLQDNLNNRITGDVTASTSTMTASLEKVLELERADIINILSPFPLYKFVDARRAIPSNETAPCGISAKWCTLNELEQNKCLWLQRAAINVGMDPLIECRQTNANESLLCLNDVEAKDADITFNDVNYGYSALKKGLSIVAYTETDPRQLSSILIVVKSNSTAVTQLSDLQGKRACFPEYGGKEWLSFIDFLRSKGIMENSCDYGKLFSDFVGSSCVPGARDTDYDIENSDQSKLCAQCVPVSNMGTAANCNADYSNKYYGSDGALSCILNNDGDYAVITKNDVVQYAADSSMFRVLSKNGSLSELPGINVDENAPLTILTAGGIVAKNDTNKKDDIILLLRDIEKQFGQNLYKFFKVFDKFNNTADLLFPDSTPGLTFGGSQIRYVDNYKTLLSNSQRCIQRGDPNGATSITPYTLLIVGVIYGFLRF